MPCPGSRRTSRCSGCGRRKGNVVSSMDRLGGGLTAERQIVRQTEMLRDASCATLAIRRAIMCGCFALHWPWQCLSWLGVLERLGYLRQTAALPIVPEGGTDADWFCPGHIDPCAEPYCYASFTIKTSDGSRSIMSARVDSMAAFSNRTRFPMAELRVSRRWLSMVAAIHARHPMHSPGHSRGWANRQGAGGEPSGHHGPYQHCLRNTDCCDGAEYQEGTLTSCYWTPAEFAIEVTAMGSDGGSLD